MNTVEFEKERILIFGGTGSLGKALISRFANKNKILCFSRDEAKHWTIKNEMPHNNVSFAVGDIRDYDRVEESLLRFKPSVVIIAAALKHVDTCELAPHESIKTNLLGVQNIVNAIEKNVVQIIQIPNQYDIQDALLKVVMVSTDKACSPINVYGMCKSIAERVVLAKNNVVPKVKFVATRYGNILESRGSIIPLFLHQIKNAKSLTLTHPGMTRYLMTLNESIDLIARACNEGLSGETWVPILRSMKISDLTNIFARRYGKTVEIIGIRPGEKLHEDLINETESLRTEKRNGHYVIKPIFNKKNVNKFPFEYNSSQRVLTEQELEAYLDGLEVFNREFVD